MLTNLGKVSATRGGMGGKKFKLLKVINKKMMERDIQKELKEYDIQPSEEIQRKIDFYLTPYVSNFQMNKWMTFTDEIDPVVTDKYGFIDGDGEKTQKYISN